MLLLCIEGLSGLDSRIVLGREKSGPRVRAEERAEPWADIRGRHGLAVVPGKWGTHDLVLSDREYTPNDDTSLLLHFNNAPEAPFLDETGNHAIEQAAPLVSHREYVQGGGSAAFHTDQNAIDLFPNAGGLVDDGDFSIEFWLYPANLSDGEVVLSWSAWIVRETSTPQKLVGRLMDRKLAWELADFFRSETPTRFEMTGVTALLPRSWHHHLLRFESETGMLEYLVDGVPEGVIYVTDTQRDGGSVLSPAGRLHHETLASTSRSRSVSISHS